MIFGQTPSKCFEIESILVDACGNPEGANEMVRLHIGPSDLQINTLHAAWPNTFNPWLGVCQGVSTAAKVAELNSTIEGCGYLLEPTNDILPAGANVLLVTSADFSTSANSFASLADTFYIIFQCPGNTGGHFANATSTGYRTLIVFFYPPLGCSDTVTYHTQELVDIYGHTGGSWPGTDRDGATVSFSWKGNPTYSNDGCNAPFEPLFVDAGRDELICPGDMAYLYGDAGSAYPVQWWGGSGTFGTPQSTTTTYTPGPTDPNPVALYLQTWSSCGYLTDTVLVYFRPLPSLDLGPDTSLCPGQIITLDAANPGVPHLWSTGDTTMTISFGKPGIYWAEVSNPCGTIRDTVNVTLEGMPWQILAPDTTCGGDTIPLQYVGSANSLQWLVSAGTLLDDTAFNTFLVTDLDFNGPIQVNILANDTCGVVADSITLWVNEGLVADFTYQPPSPVFVGTLVQLSDLSQPHPSLWNWETGDGLLFSEQNPTYRYPLEGTYRIHLLVENDHGCHDTTSLLITVEPRDSLLPNVFTPNGDGFNDVFHIQLPVVLEYQMNIFDRWGNSWFHSTRPDEVWDGTQGERKAREGVYFFSLYAVTWRGETVKVAGPLTLLR